MKSYDVFLCHNSKEKPSVSEINQVLRQQFGLETFMDESGLVGGEVWEAHIGTALAQSKAVAVLLGGQGWGKYQLEGELVPALARRAVDTAFRVIPVLMAGFDAKHLVARRDVEELFVRTMWVDLRDGVNEVSMRILAASIRGQNAFPEGRPQLTAARVRFDALRWDVTRRDTSLLYQGNLLDDAAGLIEGLTAEAALTREFITAARRHQDELIGRRLAAHAGALLTDPEKIDLAVALADEATMRHSTPEAIDVLRISLTKLARKITCIELPSAMARVAVGPRDIVIGCTGGEVVAWDQNTASVLPKVHAGGVTSLTFDTQNRWFASGGRDGLVHVWNAADREFGRTLTLGEPVMQLHAKAGPGGDWLLAHSAGHSGPGSVGHVKLWNVTAGWTDEWRWGPQMTQGAVIEAGARAVLLAWGDHLAIASTSTGELMAKSPVDSHVFAISAHPTKPGLALTTGDGALWLGKLDNEGGQLDRVAADISQAGSLRFSSQGRWLAAVGRDRVRIWDMERGGAPLLLPYEKLFNIEVFFSPDETHVGVSSGEAGALGIWSLNSRSPIYAGNRAPGAATVFFDNRRIVTAATGNSVEILELPSADLAAWTQNPFLSRQMKFSPDERWLAWSGGRVSSGLMAASSLDKLFTITDVASGEFRISIELPDGCEEIGFDPLSTVVVARAGGKLRGFPLTPGPDREVAVDDSWLAARVDASAPKSGLVTHPSVQGACDVRGLEQAFPTPGGRWLALSHNRNLTSLWDMTTGDEIFNFTACGRVHRCVFDEAENHVAFGDERGGIAVWTTGASNGRRSDTTTGF